MTDLEIASLTLRGIIGLGQISAVLYGIHRMVRANEDRAAQFDQQRLEAERCEDQREKREEQREKRADQRHAEAMEALRQQTESLRVLTRGMETVIERTAPKGP